MVLCFFHIQAAICLLAVSVSAQVGPSGIVSPDGKNIQFTHDFADSVVLTGPSGIVTKDGNNLQLTAGQASLNAATPPAPQPVAQYVTYRANVGPSGIVYPDGELVQFSQAVADNIVLVGPAGIVTKDGQNIQLRAKRSAAGFVLPKGNIGYSGILRADGTYDLFSHDFAFDIVSLGPSGIVTKSGKNIQLTDDLRRVKRSLVGPSGMILDDGTQVQFKTPFAEIALEGPSGIILTDGTLVQKRAKRALVGPSGAILPDGTPVQFSAGASPVVSGPSGIVFNNGENIQFP